MIALIIGLVIAVASAVVSPSRISIAAVPHGIPPEAELSPGEPHMPTMACPCADMVKIPPRVDSETTEAAGRMVRVRHAAWRDAMVSRVLPAGSMRGREPPRA